MSREEEDFETHPSWGLMSISRTTGGGQHMFGSTINHHNSIRIRIRRAGVNRSLSTNWYREGESIVDFELSPVQWAEVLTTIGSQGSPVTLRSVGREQMPKCPEDSERQKIEDEFKKTVGRAVDGLREHIVEVRAVLEKKTLTKDDRLFILSKMQGALSEIASNVPFVKDCFNEAMEKTVVQAKAEIDAFYQHTVIAAGMAAITGAVVPTAKCLEVREDA